MTDNYCDTLSHRRLRRNLEWTYLAECMDGGSTSMDFPLSEGVFELPESRIAHQAILSIIKAGKTVDQMSVTSMLTNMGYNIREALTLTAGIILHPPVNSRKKAWLDFTAAYEALREDAFRKMLSKRMRSALWETESSTNPIDSIVKRLVGDLKAIERESLKPWRKK